MNNYELLIQKIDRFIRKFYLNRLIKGVLVFSASALGIFLVLNLGEYFFYFPSFVKIGLLLALGLSALVAFYFWILLPLLKMQRFGKRISKRQAATIIGDHFPNVQDKLLNILELSEQSFSAESRELVAASIDQKTREISLVPFGSAIQLGKNKRYVRYLLPSVLVLFALLVFAPQLLQTATARLMQPATNFSPPAPFVFQLLNDALAVPQNGHFTLKVRVEGDKLPESAFVRIGAEELEMKKEGQDVFSYDFQNVHESTSFFVEAAKVRSPKMELRVLKKPTPEGFQMLVSYPSHTAMEAKTIQGMSDLVVPEGTRVQWVVKAKNTDRSLMRFGTSGEPFAMKKNRSSEWTHTATLFADTSYHLFLSNKEIPKGDSFRYQIQVVRDQAPQVAAQQLKDSISGEQVLLTGQASDDYGLTELNFVYTIFDQAKVKVAEKQIRILKPSGKVQSFDYYIDLATIPLETGQELSYYVEAWDNDGVRGRKRGRSEVYQYQKPDSKELDAFLRENSEQMSKSISQSASQSKELKKDMEKVKKDLLNNRGSSWEQEQNMKSLLDKQSQLKEQVEAIKKRFDEQKRKTDEKPFSEKVKEKQEAIEKQLDRLLNEELAEQLKKLQELLEQKNKANMMENLQKMEEQNKLFDMDMERIQALMKQLEMQMKLEDMANKLSDLAKEERALEKKTADGQQTSSKLEQEQKELRKKLEDLLSNEFKDLEKQNKQLDQQQDLAEQKDKAEDAKSDMQKSESQLRNEDKKNAQKSQKSAADKLEEMAEGMAGMAAGMEMEQLDIDIKAVRQLLTNLLRFSFDQEALMEKEKTIPITSPLFAEHAQEQKKLKDNAEMIKDSLFALSKRVFQLSATINKETTELTSNIQQSISSLEARRVQDARIRQQYAMANANNLALLLNETLSNMLQAQASMSGDGSPQEGDGKPGSGKPGKGKPGSAGDAMKDIISGQQKVGEGMKRAQQGQGKQSGQQGGGQSGEGEGQSEAEQIARLAQQQAQLRKQIQELSSMLNSQGRGGQNTKLLREIQELMDKNETDFVNRRLSSQLQHRQQDILTRLLEAEKSIRNQDEDDKRSANSGKDLSRPMPPELERHLKERKAFFDAYQREPAKLKPFYQRMNEVYLRSVQ